MANCEKNIQGSELVFDSACGMRELRITPGTPCPVTLRVETDWGIAPR